MTDLAPLYALANLPGHIVAAIPIALFVAACLLCMAPSIAARIGDSR